MDRYSEEPKAELIPRRPCESGNDRSDGDENEVEKKKRRLNQGTDVVETEVEGTKRRLNEAMKERGEVEGGLEKRRWEKNQFFKMKTMEEKQFHESRRLEEQHFYEKMKLEKQQFSDMMRLETEEAIEQRDELNRVISQARESLLQNGEGIFCHLSESDRVLLLETAARIKGVASLFIKCNQKPEYLCDSQKTAGPLPFSLLRPAIERDWKAMITCQIQANIEDLNFTHEVMMGNDWRLVYLRVIGEDVGDGYRKHLKGTAERIDKVFTGTNEEEGLRRPEMMRVRPCPNHGRDESDDDTDDEDSDDDEEEDHMSTSVIQNRVKRGQRPTFDVVFRRASREYVNVLTRKLVEII